MTPPLSLPLSFVLVAFMHGAWAQPVARVPVDEIRPLLMQAAERGVAYGVLVGVGATYMRQRFNATTPIEIDVRALHALPQSGCSRLDIVTRQRDVLENGERGDKELSFQLSFCRDGQFPEQR